MLLWPCQYLAATFFDQRPRVPAKRETDSETKKHVPVLQLWRNGDATMEHLQAQLEAGRTLHILGIVWFWAILLLNWVSIQKFKPKIGLNDRKIWRKNVPWSISMASPSSTWNIHSYVDIVWVMTHLPSSHYTITKLLINQHSINHHFWHLDPNACHINLQKMVGLVSSWLFESRLKLYLVKRWNHVSHCWFFIHGFSMIFNIFYVH